MFQRQSTLEVPAHLDLRENVCTPWQVQYRGMAGPSSESTAAAAVALAAEAETALMRQLRSIESAGQAIQCSLWSSGDRGRRGGEGGEGRGGTGRSSSPSYSSTLRFCAVRLPFIFIREERPAPPAMIDIISILTFVNPLQNALVLSNFILDFK